MEIELSNGVMVISPVGMLVIVAVPLLAAAIIYILVSLYRNRRRK
jgi:hypothetical protein